MPVEFTVQQHFANAPDRVFQALTDLEGAANWMPGFVKVEILSKGAFGLGTQWRATRKLFGKAATEEFEVTRFEPPTGWPCVSTAARARRSGVSTCSSTGWRQKTAEPR